jgi:hypothetical protein
MFKECAVKFLLGGQFNDILKNEDGQKSVELNDEEPDNIKKIEAFLDRLESGELSFRYCRLCECILVDPAQENHDANDHFLSDANDDVPLEPADNLFESSHLGLQSSSMVVQHVRENK